MPDSSTASLTTLDALFNNPVFAGGIGLAGLGASAAIGRRFMILGASTIKRRLMVNLEISKEDPSYQWILAWLCLPRPPGGFIASKITRVHDYSMRTTGEQSEGGPSSATFLAQPGYGKHVIQHKNAFILVQREKQSSHNMNTGVPHETITLRTLYAHRHVFAEIFAEAHQLAATAHEGKTVIYKSSGMDWRQFGDARRKRPLSSVILDEGVKQRIVDDVKDFLSRQKWYVDRGIPYRRGYLLYGPPGSVAMINLSERGMTDDRLAHFLTKLPPRTLVLLEDADAAFVNRKQVESDGYSGATVTFSGLLNALDGVAAGEERIAFLTTNHIDRLDAALIRPGRVDMIERIGEATRYQAAEMWDRFYGDVDKDGSGKLRFLAKLARFGLVANEEGKTVEPELHTSMAAIQGLFVFNKDSMEGAIDMVEGLIPRIYEPQTLENGIKVTA
ncbi:hypothetical protein EYC84_010366 [Monilinia fructicola]|uniref:BCS1 N-terminal domain-containing protein n=1 Tax=Monilinia fructicola TaxID=38448 RepID=A0A5M9JHY2_MONFR|nr:hypothetical protein EYC84_010366 [Monilinia fructicola]